MQGGDDNWQVTAVDVGYRNFAHCTLSRAGGVLSHAVEDLWQPQAGRRGKPTKLDLVEITLLWIADHTQLLAESDVIVLENQMREPFVIMNAVFLSRYWGKCVVAHPMTVGAYWRLPVKRDAKKARGIEVAREHGVVLPKYSKADDMADAWLMAEWQLRRMVNGQ